LKPGDGRRWEVGATKSHDLRRGNGADDEVQEVTLPAMASKLKWWDDAEGSTRPQPQPAALAEAL
jgi:hypothetical protein